MRGRDPGLFGWDSYAFIGGRQGTRKPQFEDGGNRETVVSVVGGAVVQSPQFDLGADSHFT